MERKLITCNIEKSEEDIEYYNYLITYLTEIYLKEVENNE